MQICFAHDIFRFACDAGNADRSGRWLHNLLAPVLIHAGHTVHRFTEADPSVASHVTDLLAERGDAGPGAWAALLSDPDRLDAVARACAPLRRFALVVGYELTPNQMRFLSATGTSFLDISIDPLRFAPDLFLRMRTNNHTVLRVLQAYDQPAMALAPHVAQFRSDAGRGAPYSGSMFPAVVFAGQTDVDASLVTAGKLASVDGFVEAIRDLMKPGWRLLLKPHPYGRKHQSIWTLRRAFPDAAVVNDNIYALINAPFVQHLVTLSSGAAQEAALLGRSAIALIAPDNTREGVGRDLVSDDHRVGLDVLSPGFWKGVGTGAVAAPLRLAPLKGELRRILGQSWGYVKTPRLTRRTLSAGQKISFGQGGDGLALCTFGWSYPEASGVWSEGSDAVMLIDAGGVATDLVLECSGFVPAWHGPVAVEIRTTPGAAAPQHVTFHNRQRRRIVISLPRAPGPVQIVFTITGMVSPKDAGLSADTRLLGIKVTRATAVQQGQATGLATSFTTVPIRLGHGMRIAASLLAAAIGLT